MSTDITFSAHSLSSHPATSNTYKKTVRAEGQCSFPLATQVKIRQFDFLIDEPELIGGENQAPTPMEFIAGAVNGCITVVINVVAKELGLPIYDIKTKTHAHMDTRGFNGTAEVSPHFTDYELHISIKTKATDEQVKQLITDVEKRCPAVNLIKDAGVLFKPFWSITQTEA